jgi:hypothetical protein
MIQVTKRSPFSGNLNTLDIPLSEEVYEQELEKLEKWDTTAFSMLTSQLREFMISGLHPDEWEDAFEKGYK